MLFCTVPGPVIKFRGAFPNVPHGYSGSAAGSLNAAVLNHCRPVLRYSGAPVKLGLNVPPVPHATLSCDPANTGVNGIPVANVKLPETENPSRTCAPLPVVAQCLSCPNGSSYT